MENINRIFAFGCSTTRYFWPCWPEILAKDLGKETINLGVPGTGNVAIFHELIAADLKYKFTQDDLIVVQWSDQAREDRFLNGDWWPGGNISNNKFYDESFIEKYWDDDNDFIKTSTALIAANKLYKLINFSTFGMQETTTESLKFYNEHLISAPGLAYTKIHNTNSKFDGATSDAHLDVRSHLEIVKQYIYPFIDRKIKESTEQDVDTISKHLSLFFQSNRPKNGTDLSGETSSMEIFNYWKYGNWSLRENDIEIFSKIFEVKRKYGSR